MDRTIETINGGIIQGIFQAREDREIDGRGEGGVRERGRERGATSQTNSDFDVGDGDKLLLFFVFCIVRMTFEYFLLTASAFCYRI